MVKVSITLPNATQITFESDEPEIIREVVGMALGVVPKSLEQAGPNSERNGANAPELEKGISVTAPPPSSALGPLATKLQVSAEKPFDAATKTGSRTRARNRAPRSPSTRQPVEQADPTAPPETPVISHSEEQEDLFARFCRSANPMADMRRVVVAAEAAHRFMGMASVDASELTRLFALAGWQLPHDFTQTLRNASRNKFRWLERVPGRTGRYSVTDLGCAKTLDK